jgi:predicted  nucleic acid-binding Zn-ribbon protein
MDPAVMLNLMVEIAGLEEELLVARTTLQHHDKRDRHLRELQDEYASDAAEAEGAGRQASVRLRQAEGRIAEIEILLDRKRKQVNGVAEPRQIQALQDEIANLAQELDRLETEGLALIDEVRRMDGDSGQAVEDCNAQEIRGNEELKKMQAESAQAKAAEEELVREIERLTALLPDNVGRHVVRLRAQYGQAVVRVHSGACGGCFGQLPVQLGLDAEQGKALVRCASCARYIVHKSWN